MINFVKFSNNLWLRAKFSNPSKYFFNDLKILNQQSSKLTNLLSQYDNIRFWSLQQLSQSNSYTQTNISSTHVNIVVNKYFSTLQKSPQTQTQTTHQINQSFQYKIKQKSKYTNLIEGLNSSNNWVFLPHFYNLLTRQTQTKSNGLNLLIGDFNQYFMNLHSQNMTQFITMEELCAMFPEKVPLSYRSRENIEKIKKNIESRLVNYQKPHGKKLNEEPKISQIIICNDKIKMWDQAYQVMLDELPCKITVPFHCKEQSKDFYKLSLNDFIQGFRTSHRIIHPNVSLQIDYQDCQQFLQEVLQTVNRNSGKKLKQKYEIQIMDNEMKLKKQKKGSLTNPQDNQVRDRIFVHQTVQN